MKTGFSLQTIAKYLKMKNEDLPVDKGILRERHRNQWMEERQKKIDEVNHLFHQGMAIAEISDVTGYTDRTVKRYLEQPSSSMIGQYGISRPGKLLNYHKEVLELRHTKKSYQEIFQIIKAKGYTGTVDAIRGYMSRQRRLYKHFEEEYQTKSIKIIERKWLNKCLYLPIEKVPMIDKNLLELLFQQHPMCKKNYLLVWRFRQALKNQSIGRLEQWLSFAKETFEDTSLLSFVENLFHELPVVIYAITHKHNNGLAEGSVNKIKTIKKHMYGRCSFNLLRKKVLTIENRRFP